MSKIKPIDHDLDHDRSEIVSLCKHISRGRTRIRANKTESETKTFSIEPGFLVRVNPRLSAFDLCAGSSAARQRFTQSPNLRGVIVCMRGINFQPIFSSVGAAFGMRAFAMPVVVFHHVD